MRSYVVRVYRQARRPRRDLVGTVEDVARGTVTGFRDAAALLRLLGGPAPSSRGLPNDQQARDRISGSRRRGNR